MIKQGWFNFRFLYISEGISTLPVGSTYIYKILGVLIYIKFALDEKCKAISVDEKYE